jgi:ABC-type glutathione transport system ATPase component
MVTSASTKRALQPAQLQAKGLSKRFAQRAPFSRRKFVVDALKNADLDIQPCCVTAVVGESGSGKSTLAACIASLQRPDSGQIWFEGNEISNASIHELAALRPKIQLVFQDSAGALNPRFTAAQVIEEPLEIQKLASGKELRQRACELMELVGLSADCAERHAMQLSGGQRQRLAIARALALQPALLILDESLSGLDLITQAQILKLLLQLQTSHALTYLLISHDVGLVGQAADFVAVMHQGTIVEQGTRAQVLNAPQHEHTRELVASARILESSFHDLQPEREA